MTLLQHTASKRLAAIVLVGLGIRICFAAFGARFVWGPEPLIHPDTSYYVRAAINLVDTGTLSPDLTFDEALFSRVPGYSLLWALLYATVGHSWAYSVMAGMQVLADTASVGLAYLLTNRLSGSRLAGEMAAATYACFPLFIFWITPNVPDAFTTFLVLAFFATLQQVEEDRRWLIVVGLLGGLGMLMREYLAPLLGAAVLHLFLRRRRRTDWLLPSAVVLAVAGAVYLPWPLRNVLLHDQLVLMRSPSSGARRYERDVRSAMGWVATFEPYQNRYLEPMIHGRHRVAFPSWVFASPSEATLADHLIDQARLCGTGFNEWEHHAVEPEAACDDEVARGFDSLRASFVAHHPWHFAGVVPAENLWKAVFKSSLSNSTNLNGPKELAVRAILAFRSAFVLLGLMGFVVFRKNRRMLPIAAFAAVIIFYLCFVFRGLQMRYLVQVDALLVASASTLVAYTIGRLRRARSGPPVETTDASPLAGG